MSNLDNNQNPYEEFQEEPQDSGEGGTGGPNRTFVTAIGVLGGLFLIALIALVVFGLVILPQRNAQQREAAAQINAQNTATAISATEVARIQREQVLATASAAPSNTPLPSATQVIAQPSETPVPATQAVGGQVAAGDLNSRTQTVAALLTQASGGLTVTPGGTKQPTARPTALPTTGFADEVGLPGMLGLGVLLIGIIFLVRRLRMVSRG